MLIFSDIPPKLPNNPVPTSTFQCSSRNPSTHHCLLVSQRAPMVGLHAFGVSELVPG